MKKEIRKICEKYILEPEEALPKLVDEITEYLNTDVHVLSNLDYEMHKFSKFMNEQEVYRRNLEILLNVFKTVSILEIKNVVCDKMKLFINELDKFEGKIEEKE